MAEQPTSDGYGTQDPNTTLSEGYATAQSSRRNTEGLPPELAARQKKYYGPLPLNKGHENGFVGEITDAGITTLSVFLALRFVVPGLKYEPTVDHKQSTRTGKIRGGKPLLSAHTPAITPAAKTAAAFIRGAYWGTGFLAFYASLSTLGIDYRSWTDPIRESEPDPEFEKVVTRVTAAGAILGAALGIPVVKYPTRLTADLRGITPRLLPLKRLPFSLGMGTYLALSFNMVAQSFAKKYGEGASVVG